MVTLKINKPLIKTSLEVMSQVKLVQRTHDVSFLMTCPRNEKTVEFIKQFKKDNKDSYRFLVRGRHSNRKELFNQIGRKYRKNGGDANDIPKPLLHAENLCVYLYSKQYEKARRECKWNEKFDIKLLGWGERE